MLIPLGILAAAGAGGGGSFESIASVSGNGSSQSLSLNSIPSTYASLQIRGMARIDRNNPSFPFGNLSIYFNSDTGNNAEHSVMGNGSTVSATGSTGITACTIGNIATDAQTSNVMTSFIIDIHNYASTTQNKTIRTFIGTDINGTGRVALTSSLYLTTIAAISSIQIENYNSAAFTSSSIFSLYGIKG
jgi:hypothetical protein